MTTIDPAVPDHVRTVVREKYGVRRPFVLFVSSLWPYKNCEGLIRAFAHARAELGGHQLVVVGPGRDTTYTGGLRALAADLGVADDVVWVGGVPLAETADFYRAADVFVYPSFNETFGLPLLEAMACGTPVMTSNVSSMPEVASDAALLVDPYDVDALARGIARLLSDQALRDTLVARGFTRARQFSWAESVAAIHEAYMDVLGR